MCTCVHTSLVILLQSAVMKLPFPFCINLPFQTCGHWFREHLLSNALVFAYPTFLGFICRTNSA